VRELTPTEKGRHRRGAFLHLRLAPARNGQRAGVTMAAQYRLGAVAQLGERVTGSHEVVGSSPISSTPSRGADIVVGAHAFRERFGYWMQLAAAEPPTGTLA
jgi:hypothetical protein